MRVWIVIAVLGLSVAPVAYAADPGAEGQLELASVTSPQQKTDFARSAIEEMKTAVRTVEKLFDQAQKEKNAEQIDCLSRKLTPMRAMLDVTQQSSNAMQQSLASNDAVHADQEFRKIAVALSKVREFLSEALACTGTTTGEKAKSVATVSQSSEDLADGSQAEDAISDVTEITPPGSPQ